MPSNPPKPYLTIYADDDSKWRWRAYNALGEVVSASIVGHDERSDAEEDARLTMMAIIDEGLKAVTSQSTLSRMIPVVVQTVESMAIALKVLRKLGFIDAYNRLTYKGKAIYRKDIEMEVERERLKMKQSQLLGDIKVSTPIPVEYNDKPQVVAVRVK